MMFFLQLPKGAEMSRIIPELDENSIREFIRDAQLPLVIDFWADWCVPCQQLAPEFQQAAAQLAGKVLFAKVNTQQAPTLGQAYGLRSVPTLMVFYRGQELARKTGVLSAAALQAWLQQVMLAAEGE